MSQPPRTHMRKEHAPSEPLCEQKRGIYTNVYLTANADAVNCRKCLAVAREGAERLRRERISAAMRARGV
jgi:hypothetical protein